MALIRTSTGFAIEYDCRLRENNPARVMDTANEYYNLTRALLEAIRITTTSDQMSDQLVKDLIKLTESVLPSEEQFARMFETEQIETNIKIRKAS